MTNPGGESSETPASDPSSGSSEPTSGGYEAPSIEQSQQHDEQPEPQPATQQFTPPAAPTEQYFPPSAPTEQYTPPSTPTEQYTPPGYAPPSTGYDVPSSYQQPADYQQSGYPPPGYPSVQAYPPPGYPSAEAQQQSYPPPYPDPSAFGGQPGYGGPAYPPPPPSYGAAPGYPPPPPSYGAPGYSGGYGAGYGQPQSETNQMAIWSLVASLVGFLCWISGPIGIALGFVALNQIKHKGQGGHGLAVAGIAVGAASFIIGLIWFIFALSG